MSTARSTARFPVPDMTLVAAGPGLLLVGLVAISSASIEYADWHYQNPWFHTQRHLIYLLLALAVARSFTVYPRSSGWIPAGSGCSWRWPC